MHVDDLAALIADVATGAVATADDPERGPVAGGTTAVVVGGEPATWRDYLGTVTDALGVAPEWTDEPVWTGQLLTDRVPRWGWAPLVSLARHGGAAAGLGDAFVTETGSPETQRTLVAAPNLGRFRMSEEQGRLTWCLQTSSGRAGTGSANPPNGRVAVGVRLGLRAATRHVRTRLRSCLALVERRMVTGAGERVMRRLRASRRFHHG